MSFPPEGAPTIQLREVMEGEEGCDISVVAKISGCPFPTLTWQKASLATPGEKADVQYDQHINKLVTQDKCTLLVQQASRHDSAIYSLTASNSLGTVSKDIKLSVFGEKQISHFIKPILENFQLSFIVCCQKVLKLNSIAYVDIDSFTC